MNHRIFILRFMLGVCCLKKVSVTEEVTDWGLVAISEVVAGISRKMSYGDSVIDRFVFDEKRQPVENFTSIVSCIIEGNICLVEHKDLFTLISRFILIENEN